MTKAKAEQLKRRTFLRGMTAAAGAAGFSPLFGAGVSAMAAPARAAAEAAASGGGQTALLAEYAARLRYEEIPQDVLQRVKDCMADTVGTILFGAQFPWSQMIIAQAKRMGAGKCAILSTGTKGCAMGAALAHGAMTHAFEQDNLTLPDSGAHPGATLVSSGVAVAQERGLSGREFLTAFVAGAEVMIRVGRATKHTNEVRGFHAPGTVGPFGAAVASGKLMQFDAAKMTNALGIAGSTSSGLLEFTRSGNGAMVKRLHMGRAAESGILAANLAADGFTGPTTVIEGGLGFLKAFCNETDLGELTRGLGETYSSQTIMMKRFACHITAHTAVEAILDLREKNKISGDDVASIEITGSQRMATVNNIPAPADITIAQISVPFCVALAFYRNPVDPFSFDDAAVHDPSIAALAARVKITGVAGEGEDFSSTVTVKMKDGRAFTQHQTEFLGMPSRPLTGNDMRQKFQLLTQKYPAKQMEALYERVQNVQAETNLDWLHV